MISKNCRRLILSLVVVTVGLMNWGWVGQLDPTLAMFVEIFHKAICFVSIMATFGFTVEWLRDESPRVKRIRTYPYHRIA